MPFLPFSLFQKAFISRYLFFLSLLVLSAPFAAHAGRFVSLSFNWIRLCGIPELCYVALCYAMLSSVIHLAHLLQKTAAACPNSLSLSVYISLSVPPLISSAIYLFICLRSSWITWKCLSHGSPETPIVLNYSTFSRQIMELIVCSTNSFESSSMSMTRSLYYVLFSSVLHAQFVPRPS